MSRKELTMDRRNQLIEIESEITKLRDFLGERKTAELEDVAQCVSKKREENVFELTESIASGDRVQALVHLVHLLDQGQNEIGIVSLIARHMRILIHIKQGLDENLSGQKLAQYAQVPSYFVQNYVHQEDRNFKARMSPFQHLVFPWLLLKLCEWNWFLAMNFTDFRSFRLAF